MRNPGLCQMSGAATFSIFSPSPSRLPRRGSATTAIDDDNLGRWELSYTKDAAPVTTIVRCGPNTTPTVTARTLRLLHTVAQAAVVVAAHYGWVKGVGGTEMGDGMYGFQGWKGVDPPKDHITRVSRVAAESSVAPQIQVGDNLPTNG